MSTIVITHHNQAPAASNLPETYDQGGRSLVEHGYGMPAQLVPAAAGYAGPSGDRIRGSQRHSEQRAARISQGWMFLVEVSKCSIIMYK